MTNCKKCNHQIDEKFCPKCGQLAILDRIDSRYITHQIEHLLNVEKGFLYTTKELFFRSGKAIKEFLHEDRNKHVKPVVFLVFTSIILALTSYFLNVKFSYFNINNIKGLQDVVSTGAFGEWLNNNIGYTNLIIGCFIALWVKIFFRKFDYNFYEILVLLCFVLGQATLILSLAFIIGKLTNNGFIALGVMLIFFLYPVWAIGQFFGKKKLINYIKSTIILILGSISYLLVFILIGYIFKTLQN